MILSTDMTQIRQVEQRLHKEQTVS